MNSVQILGNLARDPVIRATRTGRAVASFTVAVNRSYTTQQGEQKELTDWINVVAWGNLAESVGNELHKGSRVFVEGRYSTRSYETQDNQRRYVTEVVANTIAVPLGGSHNGDVPFGGQGGFSGGYNNGGNSGYRGNGGNYGGQGGYNGGSNGGGSYGGNQGPVSAGSNAGAAGQQKGNFGQFGPSSQDEDIPF